MNRDLRYERFPVSCTTHRLRKHAWCDWPRYVRCLGGLCVSFLAFFLLFAVTGLSVAAPSDVAVMVNGKPILVGEVDRQSDVQISKLHDELGVLLTRTVDRLIDERLRSLTLPETTEELSLQPVIPSVTEEEVRSYQATHEKDLAGANLVDGGTSEPEEQTAILRH